MKQNINLGVAVDSGTGDYLRRGGRKTNENFNEIYEAYGDGTELHPASRGVKYFTGGVDGSVLNAEIGQIYAIDSGAEPVTVNLPVAGPSDIGRSIIFMDPYGTWNLNNITFVANGSSTFGANSTFTAVVRYNKLEMVYANPNLWAFNPGQRLDQFSDVAEASRYVRFRRVETDGQTDFTDIFPVQYNDGALDVIVNGVDLFYGDNFSADSEYGSIGVAPGDVVALNGFDIRMRNPLSKGDIVKFVTYNRSTGTSPTSVEEHSVFLVDDTSSETEISGKVIKKNIAGSVFIDLTIEEMGGTSDQQFNIDSTHVFVDGVKLVRAGAADYPIGECSIDPSVNDTESACLGEGGTWSPLYKDYQVIVDSGNANTIRITTDNLDSVNGNRIVVKTFNYIIGTLTSVDQIIAETDLRYMRTNTFLTRENKISYSDIENPVNSTKVDVPGVESVRFDSFQKMFDTIYPVGSLYFNAHNQANPKDFMGVGEWRRYAQGRAIVGWDSRTDGGGNFDPDFGLNNNDLNNLNVPQPSAGATRGSKTRVLSSANIPLLTAAGKWLRRAVGTTGFFKNFGQFGNVEAVSSYNEEDLTVGNTSPTPVNVVQPSITVNVWVRVA